MLSLILYILFLIPSFFFMGWWLTFIFIGFGFFYFFSFFSFNHVFSLISYSFGGDVISMCFIFLSVWIVLLMILASNSIYMLNNFKGEFFLICLFLLIFLILSFSSSNMLLFYIFFESSLIPTVFLIFGWGYQPERVSAGFYLLFYTLFASLPLLIGIFYCYSISFTLWFFLININSSFYFYLSMIFAFMVKMPMIFVHFWLPKAHVEAPIAGSMVLAGVLLKLGGYGLIRVFMFITGPVILMNDYFVCLSLFGIVLVGFICLFQTDIKSLIAYSSVSHMGLVICGIFTMNFWGLYGSLILMIGHGLCSSALFCLSNIVYERLGSRSFYINKGLITLMPTMSLFWFLLCSNNIPCPPSLNLIGEIFLINSVMSWSSLSFMYLALGSFLSCCYSAYLYSVTQHGGIYSGVKPMSSGNVREFILLYFHWFPLNLIIFKCDIFMLLF